MLFKQIKRKEGPRSYKRNLNSSEKKAFKIQAACMGLRPSIPVQRSYALAGVKDLNPVGSTFKISAAHLR